MAQLNPKSSEDKTAKAASAPPPADEVKPAAAPSAADTAKVPVEVGSLKDGIHVKIEGDFVTIQLSQYMAEHIGQFRSCSHVVARFKHGGVPDITAIHARG